MWNATQLAHVICHIQDKNDGADIVLRGELKSILCYPLYVAADCLLDMLVQTEHQLNDLFQVSHSALALFCVISFFIQGFKDYTEP